jgi:zinc D-Ala-D-Ala carboxypeptidase
MKLSENFTLAEMTKSRTAKAKGFDNAPGQKELEALKLLCENILEPLRRHVKGPVFISSGFRSKKLNDLIGAASSQHTKGEAVDIDIPGRNAEVFNYLKVCDVDQLIWEFGDDNEPSWVHVSYKAKGNRNEHLKAEHVKGKVVYTRL